MDRNSSSLYDRDFYAWTQEQASVLRDAAASGANLPVDWQNVAEEIESMGKSDLRGVTSHITRIIEHLLKLEHSPASDPRPGWTDTVDRHRDDAEAILKDSPSLGRKLPAELADCHRRGRKHAVKGLAMDGVPAADIPADCPYTLEQILDEDWWPENRRRLR